MRFEDCFTSVIGGVISCTLGLSASASPAARVHAQPDAAVIHPKKPVEQVLWNFGNGNDGQIPNAGLIEDPSGAIYGTTSGGGLFGYGTVFKLTASAKGYTETTVWNFGSTSDGMMPLAGLVSDATGALFGTTCCGGLYGEGIVFELSPSGSGSYSERVLWNFGSGTDGGSPQASLVVDASGALYGTTNVGGDSGDGTVFELTPSSSGGYSERLLWGFNRLDGAYPSAAVFEKNGVLYGTTCCGGTHSIGTVFEVTHAGGRKPGRRVLWNFGSHGKHGDGPYGGVIQGAAGALFGTTCCGGPYLEGTVFELIPSANGYTEDVVWNFGTISNDGIDPESGLVADAIGDLYGTTSQGGLYGSFGTVFKLAPSASGKYTEHILWNFGNRSDGAYPSYGQLLRRRNALYGATGSGGLYGLGTVFRVTDDDS